MGQVAIPLVVGSTVIGAMGAINEGEQAQRIAEMKARQAMSVSSRKAYEERRKGDIVVSNARMSAKGHNRTHALQNSVVGGRLLRRHTAG